MQRAIENHIQLVKDKSKGGYDFTIENITIQLIYIDGIQQNLDAFKTMNMFGSVHVVGIVLLLEHSNLRMLVVLNIML